MKARIHLGQGLLASAGAGAIAAALAGHMLMETKYHVIARDADGQIKWEQHVKNRVVTAGLNKVLDAAFKTGLTTPAWYLGICSATVSDGAITASAAILTSASTPFTAGDVGSDIVVRGAGASGADLTTTILSYQSAGQVTLAANAGTTVTGANVIFEARAADTMGSHSPWNESTAYSNSVRPTWTPGSVAAGSVDNSASPAVFTINVNNTRVGGLFLADNSTKGGTTGTLYGMAPFTTNGFKQVDNGDTLTVTGTIAATDA